eukprot:Sdes_comp9915_c0_seq1m1455
MIGPSDSAERRGNHSGSYWDRRTAKIERQNKNGSLFSISFAKHQALNSNTLEVNEENETKRKQIFHGCVFYFNGHTSTESISCFHLTKLVCSHGGRVLPVLKSSVVTHVVCSNLSASKLDKILKQKISSHCLKVVLPEWITASFQSGQRLDEGKYSISGLSSLNQNKSIKAYFSSRKQIVKSPSSNKETLVKKDEFIA